MKKIIAISCAAMAAAAMPVSANAASLIEGESITCSTNTSPFSACNSEELDTVSVDSTPGAAEFGIFATPFDPLLTFDFAEDTLIVSTLDGPRTIQSTILTFSLSNGRIFSFVGGGGFLEDTASIINGNLVFDLSGKSFSSSSPPVTFQIGAIPEPGTWLLMILGLGAVGFSMRRRQKATVRYQFA
jgi:hypothetical protein